MNYRHAFHAGNFADVVKHAVLVRILLHLCGKPAPFRVLDTHAGAGLYDLAGPDAARSREWESGIARLMAPLGASDTASGPSGVAIEGSARDLLAPYLDVVAAHNAAGRLTIYPGSPALAAAILRSQDRLVACECEPNAAATLARNFAHDRRINAIAIDGWTALNAHVPPKERRGLALIDPPFEDADEFTRLAQRLEAAHRKWASGIYMLWYPIKARAEPDALARRLRRSGIAKLLRAEIEIAPPATPPRLIGCGLIVVNPPWTLAQELSTLLPELARILSAPGRGAHRIDWLSQEA